MKITVNNNEQQGEVKYPCLMESIVTKGLVVLMIKGNKTHGTGIVLQKGKVHEVGKYSEDWSIGNFTPFKGSITLEND